LVSFNLFKHKLYRILIVSLDDRISIKILWYLLVMSDNIVIEVKSPANKNDSSESPSETVETLLKGLTDSATTMKADLTKLQQKIKQIEKLVKQEKKKKQPEPKVSKKRPSGFAIPMPISKELCEFMKETDGTKVARTDVTKFLVKYIKEQKLEDAVNRRIIRPNKDLQGILSAKPEDEITYFNLQTYINHHFTEK